MGAPDADITNLLIRMTSGDKEAEASLIPLVYSELRHLAGNYLRGERPGHSLQATDLVHEVFLRLKGDADWNWQNRAHFFAVSAQMMRRVLVDHARRFNAQKRAGGLRRIPLETALIYAAEQSAELIELDDALERLAAWDQRQCRIVEMRFFAGLGLEEIAAVLGISTRTAKRDFSMARAWLYGELSRGHADAP